jgi:hypothetical protein
VARPLPLRPDGMAVARLHVPTAAAAAHAGTSTPDRHCRVGSKHFSNRRTTAACRAEADKLLPDERRNRLAEAEAKLNRAFAELLAR